MKEWLYSLNICILHMACLSEIGRKHDLSNVNIIEILTFYVKFWRVMKFMINNIINTSCSLCEVLKQSDTIHVCWCVFKLYFKSLAISVYVLNTSATFVCYEKFVNLIVTK